MGAQAAATQETAQLELVAYRDDEYDERSETVGWIPRSAEEADWALKRLGELEAQITTNEEVASRRIQEIHERLGRLNQRAARGVDFFRRILADYALGHRDEIVQGKRKTRSFLHGTVGFRKKPGALKTTDKDALLKWAQSQPVELELVRVREEPWLENIKKHAEESQEIPPGMHWEPEADEVQIRVDLKEVR